MPKMPHAGEHHGQAGVIGSGDDLVVALGAAGLDDRRRPGVGDGLHPIGEGKEGVGRRDRPLGPGFIIAAADDAGLAMVFTGMRHFRH